MDKVTDTTSIYHRNMLLWGINSQELLWQKHVAVIGLGGVGSYAAEAIARAGVGKISLLDFDTVDITNINRQLIATLDVIGERKPVDYVIDAIDSINPKLDLIEYCIRNNICIISSLGTGNRLDPTQLYYTDISETIGYMCPFAKKVRLNLKKRGIEEGLTILTSKEIPIKPDHTIMASTEESKKPPGSSPFVPPAAGLALASYVIRKFVS